MTNKHARALGKIGRARNSEAQRAASRSNGKKGGRPAKHRCGCGASGASLVRTASLSFKCLGCGREGALTDIAQLNTTEEK